MTTLYQIVKSLQETSGSKAKAAILEANKGNELLQQYLKAVYDPRINYYITKLPKSRTEGGEEDFCEAQLADMHLLATRVYTGKAAKDHLADVLHWSTPEAQELIGYIIKRDIKAGVGEGTILKVWPELFYIPPYQRCAGMDEKVLAKFSELPYFYVQTKSDGQFCYAIKRSDKSYEAITRAGSVYPQWVCKKVTEGLPEGFVAMGELLVYKAGVMLDRKTGNGILNAILQGDEKGKFDPATMEVKFLAWDLVTEDEFDMEHSSREYRDRLRDLEAQTDLDIIPAWVVNSVKEANKIQAEHLARGLEGTVWKNPEMKWRNCSGGDPDMVKAKLTFQFEGKITGMYEGTGKAAGMLGGFNMASSDDLIQFNVGSGFSDAQRKEYWSLGEDYFIGRVATLEGNDIITSKGKDTESIFLPIFIEVRLDRHEADSRDRIWAQLESAKLGVGECQTS